MAKQRPIVGKSWVDEAAEAILAIGNQAAKDRAERIGKQPKPAQTSQKGPSNPLEVARGMARAGAQELSLNLADDAMGVYKGGLEQAWNVLGRTGLVQGTGRNFTQASNAYAEEYRRRLGEFKDAHPILNGAAQVAGALAFPQAKGVKAVDAAARVFDRAAVEGAKGAMAGWNDGHGFGDRAMRAVKNGAWEAGAGAVGVPAGDAIGALARPVLQRAEAVLGPLTVGAKSAFSTAFPATPLQPRVAQQLRSQADAEARAARLRYQRAHANDGYNQRR